DAIASYFADHQAEFTLAEDVALVSYARFDDRGAANRFRSGIVRGSTWTQATEDLLTDTLLIPHLKQLTTREYVTRPTLFPEELWKIARTLNPPGVSFVVNTESGYYVLYLHDFRRQGATADLPYVAEEIHGRLLIQSRRERHEELLRTLRSRFPVEVRFGSAMEDTAGGEDRF
ncbi:MAG: peptidylprolyl isomerase, partial [Ignavibacteria bacterium]|nr:peptidylprolyl isomerase [Ignavibacteria bacterium]